MALHDFTLSAWAHPGQSGLSLDPLGSSCPPPGYKSQQNSPELAMAPWLRMVLLGFPMFHWAHPGKFRPPWLLLAPHAYLINSWLQVPAEFARTLHSSPGPSWLGMAVPSPCALIQSYWQEHLVMVISLMYFHHLNQVLSRLSQVGTCTY